MDLVIDDACSLARWTRFAGGSASPPRRRSFRRAPYCSPIVIA